MKFLLTTIGTIGDINGFLGVGQTLRQRGHDVTFITNPRYESVVRKTGVAFVPVGTEAELNAFLSSPDFYQNSKAWKSCLQPLFVSPMRELYQAVASHYAPGETALIGSGWSFGARIAQEKLGIPMATLHLETQTVRSLYDTPLMPPPMVVSPWVPRFAKRLQFWVADKWFIDPQLAPATNSFRRELGLPPVNRFMQSWWNSPQCVIGMYPEWFCARQPDWPAQMVQTGFSNWDQSGIAEIPRDLQDFVEQGPSPIVFCPGSNNASASHFFAAAVEACVTLGQRGVLITSSPEQLPASLPDTVRRFSYVPFSYLLGRSRAVVHHGGRGTASPALAAAIPQVVSPMTFGQHDFARRLVQLGVAELVKPAAVTGRTLSQAIGRLTSSDSVAQRCRELAAKFNNSSPLEKTCDVVEKLIGTERRN